MPAGLSTSYILADTILARAIEEDHVSMFLAKPVECRCGRMVVFVVNYGGKTTCLECYDKRAEVK